MKLISTFDLTATTTAAPLPAIQDTPSDLYLVIQSAADILIGDSASQTFRVVAGGSLSIPSDLSQRIYIKSTSGTAAVSVLAFK